MNNARRKTLERIQDGLSDLETLISDVREAEQESLDALPENMQSGDKANQMQAAIDALDNALNEIESCRSSIEEAGAQ